MINRAVAGLLALSYLSLQVLPGPALADNSMGYRLMTAEQASALPRGGGKLGLNVGHGRQITSGGMTFEVLRVNGVAQGSAGDKAGFRTGDQIIAVDGKVFPSTGAFASYLGSIQPAGKVSIDYMPAGGGPEKAQRVAVTLGGNTPTTAPTAPKPESTGLSTGQKIAIGVGAAALFGCYKLGCFSHFRKPAGTQMQPAR